jgi:hypothetical protein
MLKSLFFIILISISSCASPRPVQPIEHRAVPAKRELLQDPSFILDSTGDNRALIGNSSSESQVKVSVKPRVEPKKSESFYKNNTPTRTEFKTNLNRWELLSDDDGVKTYREINPAGDIVSFRGEALLHASIENLAAVLNTPELRKEWVDSLADTHTIEKRNMLDRIEYIRSKVPWPFQDRDFVFRVQVQVEQSPYSMFIKMNSVDDHREPPHPGVVRGNLLHAYYFLRDESTSQATATKVVVEIAADPKGSIPSWIVNLTQKKWPNNTLHSLEKVSNREDLFVAPEIKEFFNRQASVP